MAARCKRIGNGSTRGDTGCGAFPCKGGGMNDFCYLYLRPGDDKKTDASGYTQWQRLLRTIGRPDLVDDPRFATRESRNAHKHEIDSLIHRVDAGI